MKKFMVALTCIMVVIGGAAIVSDIKVNNKNATKNSVVTETTTENTTSRDLDNEYDVEEDITSFTETTTEELVIPRVVDENDEVDETTKKSNINSTSKSTIRSTTRSPTKSTTKTTTRLTTKPTSMSTTKATTTPKNKTTKVSTTAYYWSGRKLSRENGSVEGPSGRESYYNTAMDGVISTVKNKLGLTGEQWYYWERNDGVKMYGKYIICASNTSYYNIGNIVDTTLGKGIILDTKGDHGTIYIATNW